MWTDSPGDAVLQRSDLHVDKNDVAQVRLQ